MRFRLNKYEIAGKFLKYFDAFELYRATVLTIRTFKIPCQLRLRILHSFTRVLMKKQLELRFTI